MADNRVGDLELITLGQTSQFMKKLITLFAACFILFLGSSAIEVNDEALTANFVTGDTKIASINQLAFGPEGILFIGDSKNATIYALNTKDNTAKEKADAINMEKFDHTVAAALGTTADKVNITDLAVNPVSKTVYFAVTVEDGTAVLLKLNGDAIENVSLKDAHYSKIDLNDAVAADAKDRRGRALRHWAIADLKYHNGAVLVSGLSNKEFQSTFRSIPFPFKNSQDYSSLEIYHAAHGRYETYAPIKAFDIITIDGKEHLLASYTCTPLVLFPIDDLKGGKHIKGRTVAELGGGNSPLDMIHIERDGKPVFYMSNTNRPIMRIKYDAIASYTQSLTEPVEEFAATAGVEYDNLPFVNVLQLDDLDSENMLLLQRTREGNLVLKNRSKKWM